MTYACFDQQQFVISCFRNVGLQAEVDAAGFSWGRANGMPFRSARCLANRFNPDAFEGGSE